MASSVNNIAATFSKFPKTPSQSSSSSSSPLPPKKLSTSWNLHTTIPKSQRLSLLSLYGPAGPPRRSTVPIRSPRQHQTVATRVPTVALSYVDGNDAVRTVGLSALCKGKRVAIVGALAAFSPACGTFVKAVVEAQKKKKRQRWDLVACVSVNDVFVMRAWGRCLGVGGDDVVMLSDGGGELAAAIGKGRFCAIAVNGVITGVDFDDDAGSLTKL